MWMYVRQAPPHAETAAIRPQVIWITASAFRQVISVAACTVLHYAAPLLLLLLLLLLVCLYCYAHSLAFAFGRLRGARLFSSHGRRSNGRHEPTRPSDKEAGAVRCAGSIRRLHLTSVSEQPEADPRAA